MQDATAQMALLQFMMAVRDMVAVPSTVHCDHLILAEFGSKNDIKIANKKTWKFMNFWNPFLKSMA